MSKKFLIKTSETIHKFYEVTADNLKAAEQITFDKRNKINTIKSVQIIESIKEL